MSTLPHHLAAVWFADVVGYTRLSEEDEATAWRLIQVFQRCVNTTVDRFGGRVVKFLGDGALAEFPSTDLAVRSAHALIPAFAKAARSEGLGDRLLRVGVHVGDVGTAPDGDLFGDGVNVASRIQSATEPGEVWVSDDVYRQLRQRTEFMFAPRGEHHLKGLLQPLTLHAVDVTGGEAYAAPAAAPAPSRRRALDRRGVAALALGVVVAAVALWLASTSPGERGDEPVPADRPAAPAVPASARSVAVLPFVNMSDDPEQEYFSDGLTEELLNELARVPGLKVPARTSSFAFKGKPTPIQEIARTLGVAHVLEGSVRKSGNRVRITAQLIDAATGYHMWSQTYDRDLADVFAVQTDVSRAVAEALQLELRPAAGGGTDDPEAHNLYLRANYLLRNRFTAPDLQNALDLFTQATARDPEYADAHVGMGIAWGTLADDWLPPREAYPKALAAARRALEIDPDHGDAHYLISVVLLNLQWDLDAAERELRTSIELNPNSADAYSNLAGIFAMRGSYEQSEEYFQRSLELDPLSPFNVEYYARLLIGMRRFPEAEARARDVLEVDPDYPLALRWLGDAQLAQGRPLEALETFRRGLETSPEMARLQNGEARALAALGRREEARTIAEGMEADAEQRYVRAEEIAGVWAAMGDLDRAFRWLDRAVEDRSAGIPFLTLYPMYDPLRSDARFDRLIQRLGLPDPNRGKTARRAGSAIRLAHAIFPVSGEARKGEARWNPAA